VMVLFDTYVLAAPKSLQGHGIKTA